MPVSLFAPSELDSTQRVRRPDQIIHAEQTDDCGKLARKHVVEQNGRSVMAALRSAVQVHGLRDIPAFPFPWRVRKAAGT